jgi:hypothetical protein
MAAPIKKIAPPPTRKEKEAPPTQSETIGNLDKITPEKIVPLNFRVPAEFRKNFKQTALDHDLTGVGLLYKMFDEFKKNNEIVL